MPTPPLTPEAEAVRTYKVAAERHADRAYQDFIAEYERRIRDVMNEGVSLDEAGFRVMAELDGLRRDIYAGLADALLSEEAELERRIAGRPV